MKNRNLDYELDESTLAQSYMLRKFYRVYVLETMDLTRGDADLSFLNKLDEKDKDIVTDFLRKNINTNNPHFIEAMGILKDKQAVLLLEIALKKQPPYFNQLCILKSIWKINGDTTYFEYIKMLPESESEYAKYYYLEDLLYLNNNQCIQILLKLLNDESGLVSSTALRLLNRIELNISRLNSYKNKLPHEKIYYVERKNDEQFVNLLIKNIQKGLPTNELNTRGCLFGWLPF